MKVGGSLSLLALAMAIALPSVAAFVLPSSSKFSVLKETSTSTLKAATAPPPSLESLPCLLQDAASTLLTADSTGEMAWKAAGATTVVCVVPLLLLLVWDKAVDYTQRRMPQNLILVQESLFSTLAGLGVINVIMHLALGTVPVQKLLTSGSLSKDFFGKPDILAQQLDFVPQAFFQLSLGYALCAGAMILRGLKKLDDIDQIQRETGPGEATAEELANYIELREFNRPQEQPGYIGIQREIFMKKDEWSAKLVLLQNHIRQLFPALTGNFRVEAVMEESFAENLYQAVQIPNGVWLFFLVPLVLTTAVDLSHGVINSGATNAASTAGLFVENFGVFNYAISATTLAAIWGYWNCWKMTQIKYMILPKLEPDPTNGGRPILRQPPMYNDYLRQNSFDPSPPSLRRVEALFARGPAAEPQTIYDDLFGQAGAKGLDLYASSIQYQAWFVLSNVVFLALHILPRDLEVMVHGMKSGDMTMVGVELWAFGIMAALNLFQLVWMTPRTFWNYCLVYSMEGNNLVDLLARAGYGTPTRVIQPRTNEPPPPTARSDFQARRRSQQQRPSPVQRGVPRQGGLSLPPQGALGGQQQQRRSLQIEPDNAGQDAHSGNTGYDRYATGGTGSNRSRGAFIDSDSMDTF